MKKNKKKDINEPSTSTANIQSSIKSSETKSSSSKTTTLKKASIEDDEEKETLTFDKILGLTNKDSQIKFLIKW